MLWHFNEEVPYNREPEGRVQTIKRYLKKHWAATIEYDHEQPIDDRRFLKFEDPKKATEFVLRYG